MKISASIYSTSRPLEEVVRELDAHRIDLFHVDCNDDPKVFDDIARIRTLSKTPIDLHIITSTPEKYFPLLEKTPCDYVTFQFENLPGHLEVPSTIKGKLGLAITAVSDIDAFDAYASRFDFILMMATIPGKSGGEFNKEIFRKIRAFRKKYPEKRVHVDGGVNGEVSFILRNMGVYSSVSGSYLFKADTLGLALLNLKTHEHDSHFLVKDFMLANARPDDPFGRGEIPVLKPGERSFQNVLKNIEEFAMGFTILADNSGKLEGIISNADVRKGLLKNIGRLDQISEQDITNKTPVTVNENATVVELIRLIKSKKFPITYLPVVNNENHVTGALTFFNLVKGEA